MSFIFNELTRTVKCGSPTDCRILWFESRSPPTAKATLWVAFFSFVLLLSVQCSRRVEIRYVIVSIPSSRDRAAVHRTAAFYGSNLFLRQQQRPPSGWPLLLAESVRFELTVGFPITSFQDWLLKPLGQLSRCAKLYHLKQEKSSIAVCRPLQITRFCP